MPPPMPASEAPIWVSNNGRGSTPQAHLNATRSSLALCITLRVDQQDVLPDGHLHQRQLRPEGAFTDEFGVEADAARTLLEVRIQLGGGGDPGCHGSGPTTRVCSGRGE
ncbi:hypothetical protein G6F57_021267 [Rhizopus arrhizus]|nr:hypothetical protein G6F57_021267 [Rhizopus arrhizus]